jgi:hypothetical protein
MIGRSVVVRRRPLLRAAAVGATVAVGRAARRHQQQRASPGDAENQPAVPAQGNAASAEASMMDQLSQLSMLHQQGALTDDEFAAAKAKVLSS